MAIELQDALERAKLMSDDDGLLGQQAYGLLVDKLDEEDLHAFSMALLDFGISVKTASASDSLAFREAVSTNRRAEILQEYDKMIDYRERMVRAAQSFVESPGGLWVPEEYQDDEDDVYELTEEDLEEVDEGIAPETSYSTEYDVNPDVDDVRSTLESAGLSITSDGKINFYQSNIPGLYTQKLPQSMTFDQAITYFDQVLDSTDKQQGKVDSLLDTLSALTSQIYGIEGLVDELQEYKFSTNSKNPQIRDIGLGVEAVQQYINEGDWNGVDASLTELKGIVDEYYGSKYDDYDRLLEVVSALDRLEEMKEDNPELYNETVSGLGGVAARKRAQYFEDEYVPDIPKPAPCAIKIEVGKDVVDALIEDYYTRYDVSKDVEEVRDEVYSFIMSYDFEELMEIGELVKAFRDYDDSFFDEYEMQDEMEDESNVMLVEGDSIDIWKVYFDYDYSEDPSVGYFGGVVSDTIEPPRGKEVDKLEEYFLIALDEAIINKTDIIM